MSKIRGFVTLSLLLLLGACGGGSAPQYYSINPDLQRSYDYGTETSQYRYQAFKSGQAWEILARTTQEAYKEGSSGKSCGDYNDGRVSCQLHRLQKPVNYPNLTPQQNFEYQIARAFNEGVRSYIYIRSAQAHQDAYECALAWICVRPASSHLRAFEIREKTGEVKKLPFLGR